MATHFERKLGDSELSYFLPSRANGVNDMYLHLGFRAPPSLVSTERIQLAWAILRGRHPLLASQVVMDPGKYDSARFIYNPPSSPITALEEAQQSFVSLESTKDALINSYLNGPRTLSDNRLSYLILSNPSQNLPPSPPQTPSEELASEIHFPSDLHALIDDPREFNFFICAVHFLGDGMALHTFANDLFTLLAGEDSNASGCLSTEALRTLLENEWRQHWDTQLCQPSADPDILPVSLEARLPRPLSKFQRIAHMVEFRCAQERLIGGHAFPKASTSPERERHTIVSTVSFDKDVSKMILGKCKTEGVSIAHVMFAMCNVVWARIGEGRPELPMMMYSALNLRPYLPSPSSFSPFVNSYWFLAVGYFNVILPSFCSDNSSKLLWCRARMAKKQCALAAKTPLLLPRTKCMSEERGERARKFAALDDSPSLSSPVLPPTPVTTPSLTLASVPRRPPSTALLGLSLLGNLDAIYKHATYPAVQLHTLTTGSRQREGGLLVFGYTFAGKLWLSLGFDESAYDKVVGEWWDGVVNGIKELA